VYKNATRKYNHLYGRMDEIGQPRVQSTAFGDNNTAQARILCALDDEYRHKKAERAARRKAKAQLGVRKFSWETRT
jgi:hypothetical protein